MPSLIFKAFGLLKALATPRNLIALLIVFAMVQTVRIGHIKHDLAHARADLVDPVTNVTWQREAIAAQADLKTCKANTQTLKTRLDTQNAALKDQKARDDKSLAQSAKAAQDARAVAASARHEAERILNQHLTGATACERAEDARRKYLERLK